MSCNAPSGPDHLAIIMDGNGRWAEARGRARVDGHREGAERVREVVTRSRELGLRHLSNFLLWQAACAELCFTDVPWPEFGAAELDRALAWYRGRRRRFGLVGTSSGGLAEIGLSPRQAIGGR